MYVYVCMSLEGICTPFFAEPDANIFIPKIKQPTVEVDTKTYITNGMPFLSSQRFRR